MEAVIRTNDKNRFNALIQFLRSLNFQVETKVENELSGTSKRKLLDIIRKGGDGKSIADPQAWQRKVRKDGKISFEYWQN